MALLILSTETKNLTITGETCGWGRAPSLPINNGNSSLPLFITQNLSRLNTKETDLNGFIPAKYMSRSKTQNLLETSQGEFIYFRIHQNGGVTRRQYE